MRKQSNTPAPAAPAATPLTTLAATLAPTTPAKAPAKAPTKAPTTPPSWVAQPWAATLPKSLVAKHNGLLGAPKGMPANITLDIKVHPVASTHFVPNGLTYTRARAHNLAWATVCNTMCSAQGGATMAQMVAAGVGLHSVLAYVKRGWFIPVQAPAA